MRPSDARRAARRERDQARYLAALSKQATVTSCHLAAALMAAEDDRPVPYSPTERAWLEWVSRDGAS